MKPVRCNRHSPQYGEDVKRVPTGSSSSTIVVAASWKSLATYASWTPWKSGENSTALAKCVEDARLHPVAQTLLGKPDPLFHLGLDEERYTVQVGLGLLGAVILDSY